MQIEDHNESGGGRNVGDAMVDHGGEFVLGSDIRKVMAQLARCEADLQTAVAATASTWSHSELAPAWHSVYLRISRAQAEIQQASRVAAAAMAKIEGCERRRHNADETQQNPTRG